MNIVDRYVSKRVVYKKHYQLVGCAALWIAAKFEDAKDRVPTVRELADMCCTSLSLPMHAIRIHASAVGWPIVQPMVCKT
jgi:hypothetical protein